MVLNKRNNNETYPAEQKLYKGKKNEAINENIGNERTIMKKKLRLGKKRMMNIFKWNIIEMKSKNDMKEGSKGNK